MSTPIARALLRSLKHVASKTLSSLSVPWGVLEFLGLGGGRGYGRSLRVPRVEDLG